MVKQEILDLDMYGFSLRNEKDLYVYQVKGAVQRDVRGAKMVPIDRRLYEDEPLRVFFFNIHRNITKLFSKNRFRGVHTST